MKSNAFIQIVADAYKLEEKTVKLYARFMKEAGLITSGARGVNAPHMHPRDAVRLTIALLATGTAAHSVRLYKRFSGMTYQPDSSKGPHPASLGVHEGATLESVLVNMFTAYAHHGDDEYSGLFAFMPYLELQENQRIATIEHYPVVNGKPVSDAERPAGIYFSTRNRPDDMALEDIRAHGGIFISRGVAPAALTKCTLPFYLEWCEKVSWETMMQVTREGKGQYNRSDKLQPEKGLWFDRDLGDA